jgi:hypothetical protein
MKKFIIKITMFVLPIMFLSFFTFFYYSTDKGDLIRVGYIIDRSNFRNIFHKELKQKEFFSNVSDINLNTSNKFSVLTIGDSFSGQKGFGYKNYLAKKNNITVLHLDRFLSDNPIQTTYSILNGDLLDKIKVDYIILQSVEREFVYRSKHIDTNKIMLIDSLKKQISLHKDELKNEKCLDKLLSNRTINFPLQNILYLFDDNAFGSNVYKVKTKVKLFSVNNNELLFYSHDLSCVKGNNDLKSVFKLNEELNYLSKRLKEHGIKLIVLPSPDKYDYYYDYIVDKNKYPKPLFFDNFEKLPKDYLYLNSKQILKEGMKKKKDVYFYDDSHWSPWVSQIIANNLDKIINDEYKKKVQ